MFFDRLSIIKLRKATYIAGHTGGSDYKCDLVIIRTLPTENAYILRYPDGYTQQVCHDQVLESSVVSYGTPYFPKRAINCEAFRYEYSRNQKVRDYVKHGYPNIEWDIPIVNNQNNAIPIRTVTVQMPTEPVTLESLDKKIQLILDCLKQGGHNV